MCRSTRLLRFLVCIVLDVQFAVSSCTRDATSSSHSIVQELTSDQTPTRRFVYHVKLEFHDADTDTDMHGHPREDPREEIACVGRKIVAVLGE